MRITSEQAFEALMRAVTDKTPFSAIRLGDGEGRVMGFPDDVSMFDMIQIWEIWFGHANFTEYQVKFLQQELQTACRNADIVGLPIVAPDRSSDFGRVEVFYRENGYSDRSTRVTGAGFHLDWQASRLYEELLHDRQSVCVIGSRNVAHTLQTVYGVKEVLWETIPPEMRYSALNAEEHFRQTFLQPHLFHHFFRIWNYGIPNFLSRGEGTLVLVGGGVLGKLYVGRVKALGGVGLDIGSMMDLWAGLKTRAMPQFDGLLDLT